MKIARLIWERGSELRAALTLDVSVDDLPTVWERVESAEKRASNLAVKLEKEHQASRKIANLLFHHAARRAKLAAKAKTEVRQEEWKKQKAIYDKLLTAEKQKMEAEVDTEVNKQTEAAELQFDAAIEEERKAKLTARKRAHVSILRRRMGSTSVS